jgi:hypothetical protein
MNLRVWRRFQGGEVKLSPEAPHADRLVRQPGLSERELLMQDRHLHDSVLQAAGQIPHHVGFAVDQERPGCSGVPVPGQKLRLICMGGSR